MLDFLKKVLGAGNDAQLKKLEKTVDEVMKREAEYHAMENEELQEMTEKLRERLRKGETEDDILPDAFATVREAAARILGMMPYRVQVMGGIVLHQGRIAEMKTGEGKTLVATMPAYLNALRGEGVHVVTVNDYLARRDSEWMGKVYRFLKLSVGLIVHDMEASERQAAYNCDITYGTNNELGFDYLRDNMVRSKDRVVQTKGHAFAIVDEVDSILIDEARTPLIISGMGEKSTELYDRADEIVSRLKRDVDFEVEEKKKAVTLTDEGAQKVERFFGIDNINDPEQSEINHHIHCALRAHNVMKRDVDYVVQNGQVIIVDEFTGRLMIGRRYSEGLHQAIEAKEHVKVERENKTLATITFQNYFRMYKKLSGMTGTAKTEEPEFQGIYALDVVEIPTNKKNIREDLPDLVYRSKAGKFKAVVASIEQYHATGQPLLVGTVNVETSEMLSKMLSMKGIKHEVLNAKNHAKEAEIVAQAGHYGAVTIATNMAGRGTDILLGGNPDFLARRALRQEGLDEDLIEEAVGHNEDVSEEVLEIRKRYQERYREFKAETDREHERVLQTGGLHIIGTERHESRRIDNQLRGRSGRQGDPGSTQFFISLEDDLMRLFGGERVGMIADRIGLTDETPMTAGMLTKQIENAQKRIEGRNFETRKHVLEYDDVMNRQREVIYGQRRRVLDGEDVHESILRMKDHVIDFAANRWMNGEEASEWEWKEAEKYLENMCVHHGAFDRLRHLAEQDEDREGFIAALKEDALEFYHEREKMVDGLADEIGEMLRGLILEEKKYGMRQFEREMLLASVDSRWMDHIDAMDQLRDGIGYRAYSGKNPVTEYQIEAGHMYEELNHLIREDTVRLVYQMNKDWIRRHVEEMQVLKPIQMEAHLAGDQPRQPKKAKPFAKIGRNDPCYCGSGKKYKNCCMEKDQAAGRQ